jgi:hypothetical protein
MHLDLRPLADPTLVVVAVVYAVLWFMAAHAGLLGLPLAVLLFFSSTRYGYAVLRGVAQGRPSVPPPDLESMNPIESYQTLLHSVFFGGALFALLVSGAVFSSGLVFDAARFTVAVALLAIYPASAALLALSGDLGSAMNLGRIKALIATLSRQYAVLVGAWCALVLASTLVLALPWWPLVRAPLTYVISIWTGLALYALIGSVMRMHRHRLDIPGEIEPAQEIQERYRRTAWQGFLDRAYASIRSGHASQGYRTIAELVESEHGDLLVQQWIFERMLAWEDRRHALAFAARLVDTLLRQGHEYDALEVVTRCKRVSVSYRPEPAAADRLSAFARSIGRDGIADELIAGAQAHASAAPADAHARTANASRDD